ncbi:hypothetical protein [Corynebacterium mastitidis]|uniref:hypothetical protein n=1 Tax=Corynebacterium mastitidis TaxID=161890 RepID=UPI00254AF1EF|nr:hypothetical protein [Corynebacterium mastitidis]MDK8451581.1 hypothetical protein [Corynebacterium mastitidis]
MSAHPAPPALGDQARDFAEKITQTARLFAGDRCTPFTADIQDPGSQGVPNSALIIVSQQEGGFPVYTNGEPHFSVEASWECSYDGQGRWMRIRSSEVRVLSAADGRRPIFRYEFYLNQAQDLPAAHIHFHGDHPAMNQDDTLDALNHSLDKCGAGSPRAKRIQKGKKKPLLSSLHFPVGGVRFRPILEDVLLMLIEEYGAEPQGDTRENTIKHLERHVLEWRTTQVQAVVQDMPATACQALSAMGYQITPPDSGAYPDKPEKIARR